MSPKIPRKSKEDIRKWRIARVYLRVWCRHRVVSTPIIIILLARDHIHWDLSWNTQYHQSTHQLLCQGVSRSIKHKDANSAQMSETMSAKVHQWTEKTIALKQVLRGFSFWDHLTDLSRDGSIKKQYQSHISDHQNQRNQVWHTSRYSVYLFWDSVKQETSSDH